MPVCPACSHPIPAAALRCPHCDAARDETSPPRGDRTEGRSSRPLAPAEAWAAVIGPRHTERYLRRFAALSRPGASRFGWHWPAFAVPIYWFLYRKMWAWAAAYAIALPLLFLADGLIASSSGPFRIALDGAAMLVFVGIGSVLPALVADRLYLEHCNRLIGRRRGRSSRHRRLARLAAQGGTSDAAATVAVVLSGCAVLGVVGGLGLAVWVDYGKREKIVEALRLGAGARAAVARHVDRRGTIPRSWQEAGFQVPPLPAHVSNMVLDPRTGTIRIDTAVSEAEAGAILLVPQVDGAERIVWTCQSGPALRPFSPRSCQSPD